MRDAVRVAVIVTVLVLVAVTVTVPVAVDVTLQVNQFEVRIANMHMKRMKLPGVDRKPNQVWQIR